jgi:hypothetical protein
MQQARFFPWFFRESCNEDGRKNV